LNPICPRFLAYASVTTWRSSRLRRSLLRAAVAVVLACASTACVTVRPQERAILADPAMQLDGELAHARQFRHAVENREGAMGGEGISGGGCGCN
jgi:Tfp pilus assembly protein PilN